MFLKSVTCVYEFDLTKLLENLLPRMFSFFAILDHIQNPQQKYENIDFP